MASSPFLPLECFFHVLNFVDAETLIKAVLLNKKIFVEHKKQWLSLCLERCYEEFPLWTRPWPKYFIFSCFEVSNSYKLLQKLVHNRKQNISTVKRTQKQFYNTYAVSKPEDEDWINATLEQLENFVVCHSAFVGSISIERKQIPKHQEPDESDTEDNESDENNTNNEEGHSSDEEDEQEEVIVALTFDIEGASFTLKRNNKMSVFYYLGNGHIEGQWDDEPLFFSNKFLMVVQDFILNGMQRKYGYATRMKMTPNTHFRQKIEKRLSEAAKDICEKFHIKEYSHNRRLIEWCLRQGQEGPQVGSTWKVFKGLDKQEDPEIEKKIEADIENHKRCIAYESKLETARPNMIEIMKMLRRLMNQSVLFPISLEKFCGQSKPLPFQPPWINQYLQVSLKRPLVLPDGSSAVDTAVGRPYTTIGIPYSAAQACVGLVYYLRRNFVPGNENQAGMKSAICIHCGQIEHWPIALQQEALEHIPKIVKNTIAKMQKELFHNNNSHTVVENK